MTRPTSKEIHFSDTDAAFEISIFGKSMSPDADSYARLMSAIGNLVADQTLAKFVRMARGFEGGGTYCIELEKYRDMQERMSRVHTLLIAIKPPENTRYEINVVGSCASAQIGP